MWDCSDPTIVTYKDGNFISFYLLDAQVKTAAIRGLQPPFCSWSCRQGLTVTSMWCRASWPSNKANQQWGVFSAGVPPSCSECQQTAKPRPEQEVHVGWSQAGGLGCPGFGGGGGTQAVPIEPQAARLVPGFLVLQRQPRAASSAVFPNQKSPPLFLKVMIF